MRWDLTVIDAIPKRSPDAGLLPSEFNVFRPRISPNHERGEKNHLGYGTWTISAVAEKKRQGNCLYACCERCQTVGDIIFGPVLGG